MIRIFPFWIFWVVIWIMLMHTRGIGILIRIVSLALVILVIVSIPLISTILKALIFVTISILLAIVVPTTASVILLSTVVLVLILIIATSSTTALMMLLFTLVVSLAILVHLPHNHIIHIVLHTLELLVVLLASLEVETTADIDTFDSMVLLVNHLLSLSLSLKFDKTEPFRFSSCHIFDDVGSHYFTELAEIAFQVV
jgi:hypothetical protein